MADTNYRVLMTGELSQGKSIDEVKPRLAKLFKTTPEKIDGLLKRNNVVIKKDTDLETARKYVRAIESAGAVCRMDPPAPEAGTPRQQAAEAPPEEPAARTEPRVVPIHLRHKEEERFSPQMLDKISASASGLNLNIPDFEDVAYDRITALTAYTVDDKNTLLLFIDEQARPVACHIENIQYDDFPIKQLAKPIALFRNFLYYLCRQNPSLFLEETTFDFLSGSQLQTLDAAKVEKLATNMGMLIESGDMAGQA